MRPISRLTRVEKLLGGLDIARARGIEIGALASPMLRRPDADIRFVDHADTETLRAKYASDPAVDTDALVEVDAVWGDRTLAQCFAGETFDYVIASHVFEHVPDAIGWLAEVAAVLRPGGRLILALPDRRYSFDLCRRETALAEWVDNHLRGIRHPSPGQVFDVNANSVAFDHLMAWGLAGPRAAGPPPHYVTRAEALRRALESRDGAYIDGHCSVFTARSLLELLDGLLELKLLDFRMERFYVAPVGSAEMSLVLLRQPPGADPEAARAPIRRMLQAGTDSEGLPLDTAPDGESAHAAEDPRLAALQAALAEMQASTSWRLTAPLRALAGAVRPALRQVGGGGRRGGARAAVSLSRRPV